MDRDGAWWFEALVTDARAEAIARRREDLLGRLERGPALRPFATRDWRWTPTPRGHAEVVEACRTRIREGDLFQANLCLRLQGRLEGDAFDLFATAAEALPTDRAAFVAGPWGTVASLSPEVFLTRAGRTVRSEPIKGTRPADRRAELEASAKDRAENVMIVDLVRNDLGRVCRPGTVRVAALAQVRAHAGVWHMVSEVEGELRDGVGDADLLRATFPPGSVTGAPKLAALDVIAELESTGREAYTGAIGFASPLAGLELSVAIRTFEVRGTRIWLGAGGGIVADSVGEEEAREAAAKAAPLLAAIGAGPPPAAPGGAAPPRVARRGPRPVPRPDAAAGPVRDAARARGRAAGPRRPSRAARGEPARALRPRAAGRARRARPRRRRRPRARPAADRRGPGRGRGAPRHAGRARRRRSCCGPSSSPAASARTSGATARCSTRTRPTTPPRCRCCSTPTASCSRRAGRAWWRPTPPARATPRRPTAASCPASRWRPAARARGRLTLDDLRAADALEVASALRGLQPATLA